MISPVAGLSTSMRLASLDPRAVDVAGLAKEFRILKRHSGADFGGHGGMILNLRM